MLGWDRKIHAEDHSLASQGLLGDEKGDPEGQTFLSQPHTNSGFFSCSPINFYLEVASDFGNHADSQQVCYLGLNVC